MPAPQGAAAELCWGGRRLVLLPGPAAWLPDEGRLLVADLHIGKALAFRRLGVPVPGGTTRGTLDRLTLLLRQTAAHELVVLGDFLHAAPAQAPAVQVLFKACRVARPFPLLRAFRLFFPLRFSVFFIVKCFVAVEKNAGEIIKVFLFKK